MKKTLVFLSLTAALLMLGLFPSLGADGFSYNELVDVTFSYQCDTDNYSEPQYLSQGYGSKITFASIPPSGYAFVAWIVDGVVEPSLDVSDGIIVTRNVDIVAVFRPTSKVAVVFMDANGGLVEVQYTTPGGSVTPPDTSGFSKPGLTISTEQPWGTANLSNVTADTIAYVNYVISSSETYTVAVSGGTVSGAASANFAFNAVATVIANTPAEGNYFLYWEDAAGNIVSYDATHSFSVYQHTVLTAKFGSTPETRGDSPQVFLGNRLDLRSSKSTFIGQYEIPSGYSIVEYGVLVGNTTELLFNDSSAIWLTSLKANGATGEYAMTIDKSAGAYVRAYLVVKSDANVVSTVYSRTLEMALVDLMFSEYGEGSGNNKWIEIYNPTGSAVDLSNYTVRLYGNGSFTATDFIELTGTLAAGDVYVISHASTTLSNVISATDINSTVCYFNGNDALSIYNEALGKNVDVFGTIGYDPGTSWAVGAYSTVDKTLVRKYSVGNSNSIWTASEWLVYPTDNSDLVGSHTSNQYVMSISGSITVVMGNTITLSATVYPYGATQTVSWSSDTASVATIGSGTGVVTGVAVGSATITATSSTYSISKTYGITVSSGTVLHVVINEAYGGGGNSGSVYKNDFVELYNPTDSVVDISGWTLFYASATGSFSTASSACITFPAGTTIGAGKYFLIKLAPGTGGTTDLPTSDATNTTILVGASSFKFALCNNGTAPTSATGSNVVDFVGAGTTANLYEGTGRAPAPSNTASITRNSTHVDTNDNAADFSTSTPPTPTNSSGS